MFNVCFNCGEYHADKLVDPEGPFAICPTCGHKHPFLRLPLLIISGASGAGKSTVCHHLLGTLPEVVLLDADILWRAEFNQPETHYRAYFETWLRMAKNIGQTGRPVVLFGAGIGVPENMEPCVERRYFSTLHYLALTCEDEALTDRLHQRPAWRQSFHEAYTQEHLNFNRWFKENGPKTDPVITLLDITECSIQETAVQVAGWIKEKISL